jgi:hypothetical protein
MYLMGIDVVSCLYIVIVEGALSSRETGNTVNYIVENAKILIGKNMCNVVRVMVSVTVVIEKKCIFFVLFWIISKIKTNRA